MAKCAIKRTERAWRPQRIFVKSNKLFSTLSCMRFMSEAAVGRTVWCEKSTRNLGHRNSAFHELKRFGQRQIHMTKKLNGQLLLWRCHVSSHARFPELTSQTSLFQCCWSCASSSESSTGAMLSAITFDDCGDNVETVGDFYLAESPAVKAMYSNIYSVLEP